VANRALPHPSRRTLPGRGLALAAPVVGLLLVPAIDRGGERGRARPAASRMAGLCHGLAIHPTSVGAPSARLEPAPTW